MKGFNGADKGGRTNWGRVGLAAVWAVSLFLVACTGEQATSADGPARYGYRVVQRFPHDPEAFTQGLLYHRGALYEGTGLNGRSSLRKVRLETGEVLRMRALPQRFFGEGLALWQDRLIQLTWQSGVAFVYALESFEEVGRFSYPTEGWGLTQDGQRLIMSDGSDTLYFRDPDTFEEVGRVQVRDGNAPVRNLNELEYVRGQVFANVWLTDRVARIDPQTGRVTGWLDLSGLLPAAERAPQSDVLNGIAYDPEGQRLFVTGKRWPWLYQIELVPQR